METNENLLPEEQKTAKRSSHKSIPQRIAEMKIATANAQHPPVSDYLAKVGYTQESLQALNDEVLNVENLDLNQRKEYSEQYVETEKMNAKRLGVNRIYMGHVALARIMFKRNTEAQVKLNLAGRQKEAYAAWLKDVKSFYTQLAANAPLMAEALKKGFLQADIDTVLVEIAALEKLKETQKKETAEAQMATEARDAAFDAVSEKVSEMIAYAKALMGADQALEALGIVMKR